MTSSYRPCLRLAAPCEQLFDALFHGFPTFKMVKLIRESCKKTMQKAMNPYRKSRQIHTSDHPETAPTGLPPAVRALHLRPRALMLARRLRRLPARAPARPGHRGLRQGPSLPHGPPNDALGSPPDPRLPRGAHPQGPAPRGLRLLLGPLR